MRSWCRSGQPLQGAQRASFCTVAMIAWAGTLWGQSVVRRVCVVLPSSHEAKVNGQTACLRVHR